MKVGRDNDSLPESMSIEKCERSIDIDLHDGLGQPKRLASTMGCRAAVERMDAFLASRGLGLTEFATKVGTTDRTLRSFRKKARVRADIFKAIAAEMGLTAEQLVKSKD
jgi:hypothetical protein